MNTLEEIGLESIDGFEFDGFVRNNRLECVELCVELCIGNHYFSSCVRVVFSNCFALKILW